jgi:hypothetical protein
MSPERFVKGESERTPLSNLYFTQHFPERRKAQNWVHWVQQQSFAPKSQNLSPPLGSEAGSDCVGAAGSDVAASSS